MRNTKQTAGKTAIETTTARATKAQLDAAWAGGPKVLRHYFTLGDDALRDLDALAHRRGVSSRSRTLERIIKVECSAQLSACVRPDEVGEAGILPDYGISATGTVGGSQHEMFRNVGLERGLDPDALVAALIAEARAKQQKADAKAFMKKAVA